MQGVFVRSWGRWLEHRNSELLGENCPGQQELPQTRRGVEVPPQDTAWHLWGLWREHRNSALGWPSKKASGKVSQAKNESLSVDQGVLKASHLSEFGF